MADRFPRNPLQEPSRDYFPVFDEWPHSRGIKHEIEQVTRAWARLQINKGAEEAWRCFIRSDHIPVAVQHECRVRLLLEQHSIDRFGNRSHLRNLPGGFFVDRCVA